MSWYYDVMELRDFLEALSPQELADAYAGMHGYSICQDDPYRYQARIDGRLYMLPTLPTREEMIAEIISKDLAS